jgi:hypothetical protein
VAPRRPSNGEILRVSITLTQAQRADTRRCAWVRAALLKNNRGAGTRASSRPRPIIKRPFTSIKGKDYGTFSAVIFSRYPFLHCQILPIDE